MEFSIKSGGPERVRTGCSVVGVFEPRKFSAAGAALDRASRGHLSAILARGDMEGKLGSTLLLHNVPNVACERVLLVGLGRDSEFRDQQYREAVAAAIRTLNATGAAEAALHLTEIGDVKRDITWRIAQAVTVAREAGYRFDRMKSRRDEKEPALRKLALGMGDKSARRRAEAGLEQGLAIAHGMNLAKDLGNLPANVCTPAYLAEQARELAKRYRMKVQVLERDDMEKLGMGALLSVARGSTQPPKLITLEYRAGAKHGKPVALVGKGVTFDTGGISLKPGAEMDEMKFDMCGAASVLGALKAAAEMRLPIDVIGIIPATENMPSGGPTRPGVDIATLTGACVIALGHVVSGLFANDEALAKELLLAGETAYDRAWHLPLLEDYQEQLKSNFADFANIGGRPAGAVTAACFLARFTKKFKWAHLDIAGTAWKSGKEKGATGRPVPLLTQFLIGRATKS
ncbi:MAG: leucyl aminopeptidase [Betaproteobacteria bacterium]|nr:leucyl aminopeptidase [Betaproteobacteria bacterium]